MKLLITLFSFLIFLSSCLEKGKGSIFVIPKDFVGCVIIVYNQEEGRMEEYAGNKRLYSIPSSGILKTQFKPSYDWQNFPKVYYSNINDSNKIELDIDGSKNLKNKVIATLPNIGKSYDDFNGRDFVEYSIFFIGTQEEIKRNEKEMENTNFFSLIRK